MPPKESYTGVYCSIAWWLLVQLDASPTHLNTHPLIGVSSKMPMRSFRRRRTTWVRTLLVPLYLFLTQQNLTLTRQQTMRLKQIYLELGWHALSLRGAPQARNTPFGVRTPVQGFRIAVFVCHWPLASESKQVYLNEVNSPSAFDVRRKATEVIGKRTNGDTQLFWLVPMSLHGWGLGFKL